MNSLEHCLWYEVSRDDNKWMYGCMEYNDTSEALTKDIDRNNLDELNLICPECKKEVIFILNML